MPRGIPKTGKRVSRANERRALRPEKIDPDQFYDIPETAAARARSVPSTWSEIRDGKLMVTRVGRRVLVLGAEIIRANRAEAGVTEMELATKLYGEAPR